MEYKIGDRVRVKKDLVRYKSYDGLFFNERMEKYCGKIYQVWGICEEPNLFLLDTGERSRWKFNTAMVDPVIEIKFSNEDTRTLITELEF